MKKFLKTLFSSILIASFIISVNAQEIALEPETFSGILASHNQVREKHQQRPLTWSNSLANFAQQWVNNLATTENCSMIHRPNYKDDKFTQIHGENLFWASAIELANGNKIKQTIKPTDIVKAWAEEEKYYNYQTNQCDAGEDCGHYTQMVWHESRQVGCALAICPDKSQVWACNYHPRGNYINEWPY